MGHSRKYKVGNLVICKYDFDYHYIITFPYEIKTAYYIGIVVSYRKHATIFFDQAAHYEVLCLDGRRRYFTVWEMEILQS